MLDNTYNVHCHCFTISVLHAVHTIWKCLISLTTHFYLFSYPFIHDSIYSYFKWLSLNSQFLSFWFQLQSQPILIYPVKYSHIYSSLFPFEVIYTFNNQVTSFNSINWIYLYYYYLHFWQYSVQYADVFYLSYVRLSIAVRIIV